MATSLGLLKMFGQSTSGSNGGNINSGSGQPQTGYKLVTFSNIKLGSTPVPFSQTNIKAPNGYALSNLQIKLSVTDTTGTTVPSGVNSIESALSQLQIVGHSGRPLIVFKPNTGDTTKWQNLLNDGYIYSTAPTPADSSASTAYNEVWTPVYKHFVADPSELQGGFEISGNVNTLSSRATTLNSMTSEVIELSIYADFVPVTGYVRTQYRTKNFSSSTTSAYINLGNQLDSAVNTYLAADFGTDTALNTSSTFYLAQNGNTLIPYTSSTTITSILGSVPTNGNAAHIAGFFPMQVLYKAAVDSNQAVTWEANISSTAPTGGGISNNVIIYQAEQY
jgi:hypothetical protein